MKTLTRMFLIVNLLLLTVGCARNSVKISSPDGKIVLTFSLQEGKPFYQVNFAQKTVVRPSLMGFKLKDQPDLMGPFKMVNSETKVYDEKWKPVWGTVDSIRNHYTELSVLLKEKAAPNRQLRIVFRLFDDGLGFRYEFPEQESLKDFNIVSEETYFALPGGMAWWIPGDYESYEFLYKHTPLAQIDSANTPLTVQTSNGLFVAIHEAALYDYAGMTLQRSEKDSATLKSKLVPWPDGIKVKARTPFETPWRVLIITDQPGKLIESHLVLNLNEPCKIKDTSWIEPMKYVGIWWGMHIRHWTWYRGPRHGATTANTRRYIDFASEHGIRGVLVEGWNKGWETWLSGKAVMDFTTPYDDFDLPGLVKYARSRGVELIGHHESGGNVPVYEQQIDAAFKLYHDLGIRAVKTGYAGKMHPEGMHHHGQWMVRHYQMVVEKAAQYHLMIDAHEPIKDTGISRTWPNFMTREGARGMEYNAWSEGNPPEHTVILPFTRFLAGPMDYTPGIFKLRFDPSGKFRVYTTLAKQLAYYVVLFSPLQMAADMIENYRGNPAFKFIEDVPVTWDETRVLKAKIADYLSIARRKGNAWYIGSITDENMRNFTLQLDFLIPGQTYRATIYTDALTTDWKNNPEEVEIGSYWLRADDSLRVVLSPSGGQAVQLEPINQEQMHGLMPILQFNRNQDKKVNNFKKVEIYR